MSNWQEIKQFLLNYKEVILLVHEKPDGDCLGSALALGHHLRAEGYQPILYHPELIPTTYDFLPGQEMIKIRRGKELPGGIPVIAIDCADPGRILYSLPQTPILNIDHHCSNTFFGNFNLVDPKAAATGEIIYELLLESQQEISSSVATCLYVALSADTGSFSYSNTTARTFKIAGELIKLGANIDLIRYNFYERRPLSELLMVKLALANLQFSANGKIAWSTLSYQQMSANNLLGTDLDSIISLMRSVNGVEVAFILNEVEPLKNKISFRSKKYLDANLLASEFGGGGHPRAAGCTVEGDLKDITARVVKKAEEYLQKCPGEGGDSPGRCN